MIGENQRKNQRQARSLVFSFAVRFRD